MSSGISSATALTPAEIARRQAALPKPGAATATAPIQPATAAATQAQQGAAAAQPKPEPFNAPMLQLPSSPTTKDVLVGLQFAMADDTVNASSAQRLFELHEQLMAAEKAMAQAIIDGMLV
ncbi:MAG: hypothetical protein JWM86_65 [Thermoleophilia bacterium]|nr:hypothetical protein [Thermoleophilia bacterium]